MAERTIYGKLTPVIDPPDQIEIQTKSFDDFLQLKVAPEKRKPIGLQGVFKSVFPIQSYDGKFELEFDKYEVETGDPANPQPKDDPLRALREGVTYSGALYVTFKLRSTASAAGTVLASDRVFMGDIPLMRENGAFVINGAERAIVSQLHRSPGISSERLIHANGTPLFSVRIIPDRGSWLEFRFDTNHKVWVYMDRRRKNRRFLASEFLRCLAFSTDRDILQNFYSYETISTAEKDVRRLANRVFPEDKRDPKTGALLAHRYEFATPAALHQLSKAGIEEIELLDVTWDGGVFLETMRADTTHNQEEALKDIFHKLRPGDPVTASNAKQLVSRDFFEIRRYDLGKVGRFKLNQKLAPFRNPNLGEPEALPPDLRVLSNHDIIAALRMLAAVNTTTKSRGPAQPQWKVATQIPIDDIDHLGSRRIRTVGELLENQCRIGLARTERNIHERMSQATNQNAEGQSDLLQPKRLVNSKTFAAVLGDFFARSQLSQFMDQTNPLSGLAHKRRISALGPGGLSRERASFAVRDVHPSHYGRICPIETPEGQNVGLISSFGIYAKINEYGFIETPYRKVEHEADGTPHVTDEVVYMSADQEERYVIAQANARLDEKNHFIDPMVRVRRRAEFQEAPRERVQFMDVSPLQVISIAAGLIPFLEHDDANRALMGANMMRQAVPLLRTERPYVATGLEGRAARDSKVVVVAEADGVVAEVDAMHIVVTPDGKRPVEGGKTKFQFYKLQKFRPTNASTCFNQYPIVRLGDKVKKGDVLADGPATDQGELALGKNLLVAYMPWCGFNFEDAILVSQRCVREDTFTSVHIVDFSCTAHDTKLGPEEITRDIPNVGEDALRNLDERGIVRVGAEVKPGDILVGKVTPKVETELPPEERLLRAIFGEKAADVRDTSLKVPPGTYGIVLDVQISNPDDGRPSRAAGVAPATQNDAQIARRKKKEEKDIVKVYEKEVKELEKDIRKRLADVMLGDKLTFEIVNGETGEVLIPAGVKVTKKAIDGLSAARLQAKMEPSPKADEIRAVIDELSNRFKVAYDRKENDLRDLREGNSADWEPVREVKVYIAEKKNLSVGDKLSGRHGNKGVVARILPDCDMPFLPNGQPMDIVLNPMGVPSRMNLGQVFETHLGAACRALGMHAGTPVFDGIREENTADKARDYEDEERKPWDETIRHMLHRAGEKPDFEWIKEDGKSVLYDGRTGERFDQRVMVGVTYMLKLHHLVTDKIHARAVGSYSLVTQQPLGGKAQLGGQRMGEMEVWALEAYGVAYALQEMITVKSDDISGRTRIYESIVKGQNTLDAGMPETFKVLISELKGLCLDMSLEHPGAPGKDRKPARNADANA